MALSILDGNQSATTLSTIVTSGQHIPAHTVVSLGTQAVVDITSAISGTSVCVGNLGLLQSTVATEGLSASGSFIKIGGHTGTSTTGNIVHVSAVGALRVDGSVYTQPISIASVTIGNTVTIAGTVTANPTGTQTIAGTVKVDGAFNANGVTAFPSIPLWYDTQTGLFLTASTSTPFPISGTVTIGSALPAGTNRIGVVTIGAGTVTLGAGTAEIGTVKPAKSQSGHAQFLSVDDGSGKLFTSTLLTAGTAQIGSVTASISNSVTIASLPAISGTVTANSSNGSLTTRFGSVTTANTAFATSAVTNADRKYLLIQNVTTASNVITVGIGFTPTTTQGIQLSAGAGLTFEGNYIPTGAVNLLSSVTASCFTILEG